MYEGVNRLAYRSDPHSQTGVTTLGREARLSLAAKGSNHASALPCPGSIKQVTLADQPRPSCIPIARLLNKPGRKLSDRLHKATHYE